MWRNQSAVVNYRSDLEPAAAAAAVADVANDDDADGDGVTRMLLALRTVSRGNRYVTMQRNDTTKKTGKTDK